MLKSTLVIAFALVVIIIISTLVTGISIKQNKFPSLLGNRYQNIKNVRSCVDPNNFTFVVMGDVKDSTATFESLLDIAEKENPSFIIILGDMVNHINQMDHKLFIYEISEYASKMPFFIVPGNHDISLEEGFGLKDFERTYGPAQFYFAVGPYLFVFLNDLPGYNRNGEYLDFLEDTLRANNSTAKKTFVFTHIPPSGISDLLECSGAPDSKRFTDIAQKYNVDYVFAGDHHGYVKTEKDSTIYTITGGGGARLKGGKGRFHHIVEINIVYEKVFEHVIAVKHKHGGLELLERNIAVYFWGSIRQNKLIYAMGIMYCGAAGITILAFLKRKMILRKQV
jgi:Icc-related predicted phosphoesterase